MKTQSERVLAYMKDFGGISSMQAFADLGITRLSARIYDLKKEGVKITSHRVSYRRKDGSAKHYDVYSLLEDKE